MKYSILSLFFLIFYTSCSNNQHLNEVKLENPLYDKAFEYREAGKIDSAFIYFNEAKDLFLKRSDSLGAGKCLVNMAIISTNYGDNFGGQELSLNALSYFDQKDIAHFVFVKSNFNNLGIATNNLRDYRKAIKFYHAAIAFSNDSTDIRTYWNNIGKAYQELKEYQKSLKIFHQLLTATLKDSIQYAMVLTNYATTKWLQNPEYNAAPSFLKALSIRVQLNDLRGENSSYSHLADYYAKMKPDSALFYAHLMHKISSSINSPDARLDALQKLVRLSPSFKSKFYFEKYESLADSLQTIRNAAKNQFALIRYETEKHKADNLKLQKDNVENRYQIVKQRIMLYGIVLLVFSSSVFSFQWYKKRKQKLELESQNTIRENQLKTSKKVHDVVANGIYRVMAQIENTESLDREQVLDKLEEMYEKSRDLSYEEIQYKGYNFHETISKLATSFATESTKVFIVGNTEELWRKVNAQIKYEIEHILQELMVNMKKHSAASQVAIRFELTKDRINIFYTDNGIGLPKNIEFKNGLTNTGNRIESISGAITFEAKVEGGLKIQISFPIS